MTNRVRRLTCLALGASALLSQRVFAEPPKTLQIAAAADLAYCMDDLNAEFKKTVGSVDIKVSIGSSGNFFAQIKQGAPFDVFLSADTDYPKALAKDGLAAIGTLIVYAHGQLVMWSSDPGIDARRGFSILNDPRVKRIAIANPEVAPYGRAAKAALQKSGAWASIQSRLITGENVAQTAQFVETGNAQIGFVSAGHIRARAGQGVGQAWPVPAEYYPRIEQGGIVTARGMGNPLARRFLEFLQADDGRNVLRKHGFVAPGLPG